MRKMKLLIVLLLAYSGMKAQNTALQFDGVDDYAIILANNPLAFNPEIGFTFEARIKPYYTGRDVTILYSAHTVNEIKIGLTASGFPFIEHMNTHYVFSNNPIEFEICTHISFLVSPENIECYIDGNLSGILPISNSVVFSNQQNLILGMTSGDVTSNYQGVIDEIRIWNRLRTVTEIQLNAFGRIGYIDLPIFLLLDFWEGSGTVSQDIMNYGLNYAYWTGIEECSIEWTRSCFGFVDFYPRVGTDPLPSCQPNINPLEMICNGNFEQYDKILDLPNANIGPWVPFYTLAGSSDIVNWLRWGPIRLNPDFFVRGGIGGIPCSHPSFVNWNTEVWDFPNSNNNAMAGLYSNDYAIGLYDESNYFETIATTLITPVQAGNTYKFSGWFKTGNRYNSLATNTHDLKLILRNNSAQSNYTTIPAFQLTNHNSITSNDGWEFVTITFSIPLNSPQSMFDMLLVRVQTPTNLSGGLINNPVHSYIDDLSLIPVCQNSDFPQSISLTPNSGVIPAGTYTDYNGNTFNIPVNTNFLVENHHHGQRLIETDSEGNSYIAATLIFSENHNWVSQFNPTITYSGIPIVNRLLDGWSGILVAKYNECGELQWQQVVYNKSQTALVDMAVSPIGDVYILGIAESNGLASHLLTTTSTGTFNASALAGKRVFVAVFDSNGQNKSMTARPQNPNIHPIDIELIGSKVIVVMNNSNDFEVRDFSTSTAPIQLSVIGKQALKATVYNNLLYIAEVDNPTTNPEIRLRGYNTLNVPYSLVHTSLPITHGVSGAGSSFGYPYSTISDMMCDNLGSLFVTGNFTNGLSFVGGTPSPGVNTSVFQDYFKQGIGAAGFIAKFNSNLTYNSSDYLKPPTSPAQAIQITTVNNVTYQCTPPAPGTCDFVTTTTSNYCTGLTYLCIDLDVTWVNQGEAYLSNNFFSSIYHDLSIDANNNVLVAGIVNDAFWKTNEQISTTNQVFVCKYNNSLSRLWINETQGNFGIENDLATKTTSISFNPFDDQHRVIGNFIGTTKLFDNTSISTSGNHEHIFITRLEDFGGSSVFKEEFFVENRNSFMVYPNPANHVLNIVSESASFEYTLLNSAGQIVLKGSTQSETEQLSINQLTNGVYVLHLIGSKHEFIKVVVTR